MLVGQFIAYKSWFCTAFIGSHQKCSCIGKWHCHGYALDNLPFSVPHTPPFLSRHLWSRKLIETGIFR